MRKNLQQARKEAGLTQQELAFFVDSDKKKRTISIHVTKEGPLCLTDKEALALAAIIRAESQAWFA